MRDILFRNLLYVPAYQEKFIEKSLAVKPDAYIYDLEDSVPLPFKEKARSILKSYINDGRLKGNIFVRINSLEQNMLREDMEAVAYPGVMGFLLPKVDRAEDLAAFDEELTLMEENRNLPAGYFKVIPLIETTAAVMNVNQIAKSSGRVIALCFGAEDFVNDLLGTKDEDSEVLQFPRAAVVIAAKAAGILAIDTPYMAVHDEKGFLEEEMRVSRLGFDGVQLLSPRQIELANICFTPSEEEVQKSRKIIEAWETAAKDGTGVSMLDGKMIGPPMRKRAEKILKKWELIRANNVERDEG